jgi:anti-anti-sigma factor
MEHSIQRTELAGVPAIRVVGDFDVAASVDVDRSLTDLEATGPAVIALDLRELEIIDSSGLRIVLNAVNRAREQGRRLVVVAPPSGPVGRLLELTLLGDYIELVDDPALITR